MLSYATEIPLGRSGSGALRINLEAAMNRWKASATHLWISILLMGGIALAAFKYLYPNGLYVVAGLDRLLLVMLGIDLVVGPLLTLIIYKAGKRGLKFDLAMILLAQLAFLGYGLNTIWQSRPAFIVGAPDQFTVVFANEVNTSDLALAHLPQFRRLPWFGPQLVGVKMPDNPRVRAQVMAEFMAGGAGIERSPKYYLDYSEVVPELLRKSRSLDEAKQGPMLGDITLPIDRLRWVPIVSSRGEGIALIDSTTGKPVRTIGAFAPPSLKALLSQPNLH